MRRLFILLAALLGVTTLVTGCSSTGSVSTMKPNEFVTAMGQPGTVIIDVRTPAEYAAAHVDNAVNINVEASDFTTRVAGLDKNTTYAVYCRTGRRSAIASDQMADAGFSSILNLDGGLVDLQAAGAPIVTG
jgi:rhodanese-related sulfurtransferase